ncbi:MAG: hypothetical protein RR834_07065 [Thermomonas sp.]
MSNIGNVSGSAKTKRSRTIKLAPMTRAVRSALAVSAMALALGASGGAFAAGHKAPQARVLQVERSTLDLAPVHDLATVLPPIWMEVPPELHPTLISEYALGDVIIDNADPIDAVDIYSSVTAISGYSSEGNVGITNHAGADLLAASVFGNAIGIYGYATTGDVSIDNAADIFALSAYYLADGIFASGANVDVTNSGAIDVYGYTWAAGIEAQGTGTVSVDNSGDIYAEVFDVGTAFGIYVTGADVTVDNSGNIEAQGYSGTGIEAQSSGDLVVTNSGDIVGGSLTSVYDYYSGNTYLYGSLVGAGINAISNGEGAAVSVTNGGDISSQGYYGATGIAATSGGLGGSASVTNTGNIYASQYNKYGYGAYGIVVSADGDASIDNSGGITVDSAGIANGAVALSFAGDASVTNSGDITVTTDAFLYYGANGIVAFAGNGSAYAGNSGNIDVTSKYISAGIDVSGLEGATASNGGDITVDAWRAYGILAQSGNGDVNVSNDGSIFATYGASGGTAFGILGLSGNGDVSVDSSGYITTSVTGQSVGIFARANGGDVEVSNSGVIDAYSYTGAALGIFARADYGTATVDNSGAISAYSYYGQAYGILARGAYSSVSNSGDIEASAYYAAAGIIATSYYGTTVTTTGGSISAIAVGEGLGIDARSFYGDVSVDNASDIEAVGIVLGARGINAAAYSGGLVDVDNSGDIYAGSLYGASIGIYGYSVGGDVSIDNSGDITAISYYDLADGIFASGANVDVSNSGAIEVYGYTWAAGIEAQGDDSATVDNSGDITVIAPGFLQVQDYYGVIGYAPGVQAFGIYATGGEGGVALTNSGNISVDAGYVTGIEVQSSGDISLTNSGDIVAGSGLNYYYNSTNYYTYYFGTQVATGINATSNGEGAHVEVTNSGDIAADGIFGASGIAATSGGLGGTASVSNSGNIYVSQNQKYGYGAYGIVVSADGDGSIDNSGLIDVYSGGVASGATALSFAGNASVTNSGDINVENTALLYYNASGIVAFAGNGDAMADNSGDINAVSSYWATGIDARGFGDATVENSGSVYANGGKYAFGVYATAGTGDVNVTNTDDGEIGFYSYSGRGWGVFGYATQGDVNVVNDGAISGYAYGQSAGIFGRSGTGDVNVTNTGSIEVISGGNVAVGVFARADYGSVTVDNSGDIYASVEGVNGYIGYSAYGIFARGEYVDVSNSGDIVAIGSAYATGIAATSYYGTTVTNTGGSIYAAAPGGIVAGYYGYYLVGAVTGIDANAAYGDVTVSNASDITALSLYVDATGISAVGPFDTAVTNSGDIYAASLYGAATGISASASYIYGATGTTTVNNSGSISLFAPGQGIGQANGIAAYRNTGDIAVNNSGDIEIYAGGRSYGIDAFIKYGDVAVTNSGDITMESPTDAVIGIQATTGSFFAGGGNVSVINSGNISVHSDYGFANGIGAVAGSVQDPYGNSYIRNSGAIDVFGQYNAAGIQTRASEGNATIINSGDIHVESAAVRYVYQPDQTVGIAALTFFGGDLTIQNTGDVTVDGYAMAYGLYAKSSNDGTVSITNAGDVNVHSQLSTDGYVGYYGYDLPAMVSRGVFAYSFYGDIVVNNSSTGVIDASGGDIAIGVHTATYDGTTVVNNAGRIHAGGSNLAIAVLMEGVYGTNTLNNAATGFISADGDEGYAFAVMGGDTVETINNSGRITGALALYGGNDVFNNRSGGVWSTGGTHSTDFGDGNDTLNNLAGGVVDILTGAITFGAGNDTLANAGTVRLGTGGTISFGDGNDTLSNAAGGLVDVVGGTIAFEAGNDTVTNLGNFRLTGGTVTMGAGTNTFTNISLLKVLGNSTVDVGAAGTLTNVNAIDLLDGATDDRLTVIGTLAGTGALNLDLNMLNSTVDQLVVTGNVAGNAVQTVNVAAPGLPTTAHTSAVFARVSGTSAASNFVAGQIFGYSPANFLDLDLTVSSQINTANTSADLFSVNVDVVGLSDSGSLAASVASGAAGFLNDQVGTFRQRLGVNPYGDAGKVMSAFVRVYTSEGDVDQAHVAANFGQGGNFAYDQTSWGREVGVNANLFGNFHAGVVLGTADSRQRLTGAGMGQNRMDGMTWGAYATWYVPQGFYVDLTHRQMAVDVESTSAAGLLQTRAHTSSKSLEAGYEWAVGGFNIVPQVQYTLTEVEDVRAIAFDRATFEGHGGTSERGRVGVEINKTFTAGNLRWTPYGSINAIREFDGEMNYTVGTNFFGATSTKGTSAMAELGLGLQSGGWGFTIGANWTDGGAFKSAVSGQANIRFAW